MQEKLNSLFLNSKLRETFLTEIENSEIEFVSFDVVDTLLRRKCLEPKDVFSEVARRAIENGGLAGISESDYLNIRVSAEKMAKELSAEEDICFEEIFSQMFFDDDISEFLQKLELEVESEYLFIDPIAALLLQLATDLGKRIVITSDMYLSELALKEIIDNKIPSNIKFEHFFVSSKTKKTKTPQF